MKHQRLFCGVSAETAPSLRGWLDSLAATGLQPLVPTDRACPTPGWSAQIMGRACAQWESVTAQTRTSLHAAMLGAPYNLGDEVSRPPVQLAAFAGQLADAPEITLQRIGGSFAIALIDSDKREVILAIDRFAIENMFYLASPSGVAFATRARCLAKHPAIADRFSAQAVFDSIYFHWLPGPDAGYQGMARLLPGHYLHWRNGKSEIKAYWTPRYHEDHATPRSSLAETLRTTLERAVADRLPAGPTACFLSGGLDSSTITGLCAKLRPHDVTAFTIGFEAEGYDEMGYARAAAKHFRTQHESYYVTPGDIVRELPTLINEFDAPFGNASAVPTYFCAKAAADRGHRTIFAGDGGDELFGGNSRYSKQLQFEPYQAVPKPLRKALLEPGAEWLYRITQDGLLGKAASYIRQAAVPLPERLMTYNLLHWIKPESFLTPSFLSAIDVGSPMRRLHEMYGPPGELSAVNQLLRLDGRIVLADSDLPKVNRMCSLAGIEVTYPMLDERVFDFAARLPSAAKVNARQLRPFYRYAYHEFLPRETLTKGKQGFGLPFGVWLARDATLRHFANESLLLLERQSILNRGFRENFLGAKLHEHPAYFGTLVWILIGLGLWLNGSRASVV